MDVNDWRQRIDELDEKLVELLNERARCATEIGRLKRNAEMPIYEPQREGVIFANVRKNNGGPLRDSDLIQVYERIIDVMRKIQADEIAPDMHPPKGEDDPELQEND